MMMTPFSARALLCIGAYMARRRRRAAAARARARRGGRARGGAAADRGGRAPRNDEGSICGAAVVEVSEVCAQGCQPPNLAVVPARRPSAAAPR
jgi:hypothetical protein